MTQELSTENYSAVILFFDKSKIFISKQQYEFLVQILSGDKPPKRLTIRGNSYATAQITKILDLQEFYFEYPDERPDPIDNSFATGQDLLSAARNTFDPIHVASRSESALKSLILGFEKFIAEIGGEQNLKEPSKALYERMKKRYADLYLKPQNENQNQQTGQAV